MSCVIITQVKRKFKNYKNLLFFQVSRSSAKRQSRNGGYNNQEIKKSHLTFLDLLNVMYIKKIYGNPIRHLCRRNNEKRKK